MLFMALPPTRPHRARGGIGYAARGRGGDAHDRTAVLNVGVGAKAVREDEDPLGSLNGLRGRNDTAHPRRSSGQARRLERPPHSHRTPDSTPVGNERGAAAAAKVARDDRDSRPRASHETRRNKNAAQQNGREQMRSTRGSAGRTLEVLGVERRAAQVNHVVPVARVAQHEPQSATLLRILGNGRRAGGQGAGGQCAEGREGDK